MAICKTVKDCALNRQDRKILSLNADKNKINARNATKKIATISQAFERKAFSLQTHHKQQISRFSFMI